LVQVASSLGLETFSGWWWNRESDVGCGFLFHFISLRPFLSLSLRGGYLITLVELFNIIPPKKPLIRLVLESAFIHRAKAAVLMRFPPGTIVIHSQKYSGMDSLRAARRFVIICNRLFAWVQRGEERREADEQKAGRSWPGN